MARARSVHQASSTLRASGPTQSQVGLSGTTPVSDTSPHDGLRPTRPQQAEGMRIDPPVSDPIDTWHMPVAAATAPPPVEPPATCDGSCGWRTGPKPESSLVVPIANSCRFVRPTNTGPCARRWATAGASAPATCVIDFEPAVVTCPSWSSRSFSEIGMPWSTPRS